MLYGWKNASSNEIDVPILIKSVTGRKIINDILGMTRNNKFVLLFKAHWTYYE